jgi:hypothetical protein
MEIQFTATCETWSGHCSNSCTIYCPPCHPWFFTTGSSRIYLHLASQKRNFSWVTKHNRSTVCKNKKNWCESVIKEGLITATEYHRMFRVPFRVFLFVCVGNSSPIPATLSVASAQGYSVSLYRSQCITALLFSHFSFATARDCVPEAPRLQEASPASAWMTTNSS